MARSLVSIRKEYGATCPSCGSADWHIQSSNPFGFGVKCGGCGHVWSISHSNNVYISCETQESATAYHQAAGHG